MLVIKRKLGEAIVIGEDIEIIISDISNDKVKIAINAPNDVRITRKELKAALDFNNVAIEATKDKLKELKQKLEN